MDSISKPSMPSEIVPLTFAVVWIAFPSFDPQVMNLPAIPPTPPNAPPIIAPSNAPWAKPSRNEPPDRALVIPPINPPVIAPFNAPIRIPVPMPCKPGTKRQTNHKKNTILIPGFFQIRHYQFIPKNYCISSQYLHLKIMKYHQMHTPYAPNFFL